MVHATQPTVNTLFSLPGKITRAVLPYILINAVPVGSPESRRPRPTAVQCTTSGDGTTSGTAAAYVARRGLLPTTKSKQANLSEGKEESKGTS